MPCAERSERRASINLSEIGVGSLCDQLHKFHASHPRADSNRLAKHHSGPSLTGPKESGFGKRSNPHGALGIAV